MLGWIKRQKPLAVGLLGGAFGVVIALSLVHLWQLYWSLRAVIQFINQYGPKIQALP